MASPLAKFGLTPVDFMLSHVDEFTIAKMAECRDSVQRNLIAIQLVTSVLAIVLVLSILVGNGVIGVVTAMVVILFLANWRALALEKIDWDLCVFHAKRTIDCQAHGDSGDWPFFAADHREKMNRYFDQVEATLRKGHIRGFLGI